MAERGPDGIDAFWPSAESRCASDIQRPRVRERADFPGKQGEARAKPGGLTDPHGAPARPGTGGSDLARGAYMRRSDISTEWSGNQPGGPGLRLRFRP